jgi:DNA recombination protein RmuC
VIIDAKVSLNDYERLCAAEDEATRAQSLRAHVASLRGHILGLSAKEYESLPGLRTLDFVLVFVPVEAAFLAALEAEPELFGEAYNRNIIVVSPSTLLATLRTIESLWRSERQSQNAEEIARQGGLLFDQVVRTVESLDELGRSLERAQAAYHETLKRCATGRGNLLRRTQELGRLGAKGRKQIPAAMLDRMEEEAELADGAELADEPDVASHVLPPASVPGEAA